jgi:hypothetical protein
MDKSYKINFKITADRTGAQQTKEDLAEIGTQAQRAGNDVAKGGQAAAKGFDDITNQSKKAATEVGNLAGGLGQGGLSGVLRGVSGIFSTLTAGPLALFSAGLTAVIGVIGHFIRRGEEMTKAMGAANKVGIDLVGTINEVERTKLTLQSQRQAISDTAAQYATAAGRARDLLRVQSELEGAQFAKQSAILDLEEQQALAAGGDPAAIKRDFTLRRADLRLSHDERQLSLKRQGIEQDASASTASITAARQRAAADAAAAAEAHRAYQMDQTILMHMPSDQQQLLDRFQSGQERLQRLQAVATDKDQNWALRRAARIQAKEQTKELYGRDDKGISMADRATTAREQISSGEFSYQHYTQQLPQLIGEAEAAGDHRKAARLREQYAAAGRMGTRREALQSTQAAAAESAQQLATAEAGYTATSQAHSLQGQAVDAQLAAVRAAAAATFTGVRAAGDAVAREHHRKQTLALERDSLIAGQQDIVARVGAADDAVAQHAAAVGSLTQQANPRYIGAAGAASRLKQAEAELAAAIEERDRLYTMLEDFTQANTDTLKALNAELKKHTDEIGQLKTP